MAGLKRVLIFVAVAFCVSYAYAKDITLAWDHDGNCTEFRIYRSEGESHWPNRVGTVGCDTFEFTDIDIPCGNLSYVVTAYDGVSESNTSNEELYAYYYALVKFDYDSDGRILYKGENQDIAANEGDTDWIITNYYYNSNGMVQEMRVRTTSWTARDTGW